jgi:GntR family transcriptional regulator
MFIDKTSPIPVYYQLRNIILQKIQSSEFIEGSLIPSERELCDSLNISRMTVRQALNQLVQEGILYREKGKGTYVSRSKIVQRNIESFSETVRRRGLVPSTEIIYFGKNEDNQKIKDILELQEMDSLYYLKRLRLASNVPIAIEEVFMPEKYFSEFEKHNLTSSLYTLIKEEYSYTLNYIDNTIQAAKPSNEEKILFKISSTTPVLKISGIRYSASGIKLFYGNDTYRSDEYDYNVRIFMNKEF